MLIRISVESSQPLAGSAATRRRAAVLRRLVGAAQGGLRAGHPGPGGRMRTRPEPLQRSQAAMYAGCIPNRQRMSTRVLEEHPDMVPDADCRSSPGDPAGPYRGTRREGVDGEPDR